MAESHDFIFVNYNQPNPRPTQRQRQKVSAFIGKHYRNRSAPARRAQLPAQDDKTPLPLLARKSSPQVLVALNGRSRWPPLTEGGSRLPHLEEETDAVLEDLATLEPRANKDDETLLIRPVVECYVPAYPPEHRQKVVHILDFGEFCPSPALAPVAPLPRIMDLHTRFLVSIILHAPCFVQLNHPKAKNKQLSTGSSSAQQTGDRVLPPQCAPGCRSFVAKQPSSMQ
jgi:hypothetical protein